MAVFGCSKSWLTVDGELSTMYNLLNKYKKMRTDTAKNILEFIKSKGRVSPKDIADNFSISRQATYKQINNLLTKGEIEKIGKPPKVFYFIPEVKVGEKEYAGVEEKTKQFIEQRFIDITSNGEIESGWSAFTSWCSKRGQDVQQSAVDYFNVLKKYDALRKDGLLNGMEKMKNTFKKVYLDYIFYLDFYAIERFGKTKLGNFLLYSKQSQDKKLIKKISMDIKPRIEALIKLYKVDAVGFVPPTVKREVQFMKELERNLALKGNRIKITKIKTSVVVPQKTLNKLEDRIENAKKTFVVEGNEAYKNILLIDDAIGSGATLNEIALQIRDKGFVDGKIIGLAITGSIKGFDVISEV